MMYSRFIVLLCAVGSLALAAQQNQKSPASGISAGRLLDVVTTIRPVQELIKDYLNVHDQSAGTLGEQVMLLKNGHPIIAFSRDGKIAIGISEASSFMQNNYKIYIFDLATRKMQFSYSGSSEMVLTPEAFAQELLSALAFSPDGKRLAVARGTSAIEFFSVEADKLQKLETETIGFPGFIGCIMALAYSPDGTNLIIGSGKPNRGGQEVNFIKIYNFAQKKMIDSQSNFAQTVRAVSFSPNGKFLAVAQNTNTVQIRETEKFSSKRKLIDATDNKMIWSLAYADANHLAIVGDRQVMKIWNLVKNKCVYKKSIFARVSQIAYSPDKRYLAVNKENSPIELYTNQAFEMTRADEQAEIAVNASSGMPEQTDSKISETQETAVGQNSARVTQRVSNAAPSAVQAQQQASSNISANNIGANAQAVESAALAASVQDSGTPSNQRCKLCTKCTIL